MGIPTVAVSGDCLRPQCDGEDWNIQHHQQEAISKTKKQYAAYCFPFLKGKLPTDPKT